MQTLHNTRTCCPAAGAAAPPACCATSCMRTGFKDQLGAERHEGCDAAMPLHQLTTSGGRCQHVHCISTTHWLPHLQCQIRSWTLLPSKSQLCSHGGRQAGRRRGPCTGATPEVGVIGVGRRGLALAGRRPQAPAAPPLAPVQGPRLLQVRAVLPQPRPPATAWTPGFQGLGSTAPCLCQFSGPDSSRSALSSCSRGRLQMPAGCELACLHRSHCAVCAAGRRFGPLKEPDVAVQRVWRLWGGC